MRVRPPGWFLARTICVPHTTLCVAVLIMTTTLTGCGGDDPYADYCEVVTENQTELSETLGAGGPDALLNALPIFRELREQAPDDIRDEWAVVVDGLGALEDAMDDAGVDPATYDRKNPPEGLTEAEKDRIDAAAQALRSQESVAAFAAVEQEARDVCKTPLHI